MKTVNESASPFAVSNIGNCDLKQSKLIDVPPKKARILLADDHTLVAEACKTLLEPEFEVVGICSDGRALVKAAAELRPDVIVSDMAMQLLNGLDAGGQAKEANPGVQIVYLTMIPDPDLAAEAFRRGASGYLLKTSAAAELAFAIREVLKGGVFVSPQITQGSLGEFLRAHQCNPSARVLTQRQREVLQLLAEGKSMKEAADVLNLTTRTIAFHKYRIMAALGLHNNADLVQYAIRHFLVSR